LELSPACEDCFHEKLQQAQRNMPGRGPNSGRGGGGKGPSCKDIKRRVAEG
jgi:hypothetical protein